jgi:hypothetical protein
VGAGGWPALREFAEVVGVDVPEEMKVIAAWESMLRSADFSVRMIGETP